MKRSTRQPKSDLCKARASQPKPRSMNKKKNSSLSAFNIFFIVERKRILAKIDSLCLPLSDEEVRRALIEHENNKDTRRAHRKSHGMISFKQLAQQVASRWKVIDPVSLHIVEYYAKVEKRKKFASSSQKHSLHEENVDEIEDQLLSQTERSSNELWTGENKLVSETRSIPNTNCSLEGTDIIDRDMNTGRFKIQESNCRSTVGRAQDGARNSAPSTIQLDDNTNDFKRYASVPSLQSNQNTFLSPRVSYFQNCIPGNRGACPIERARNLQMNNIQFDQATFANVASSCLGAPSGYYSNDEPGSHQHQPRESGFLQELNHCDHLRAADLEPRPIETNQQSMMSFPQQTTASCPSNDQQGPIITGQKVQASCWNRLFLEAMQVIGRQAFSMSNSVVVQPPRAENCYQHAPANSLAAPAINNQFGGSTRHEHPSPSIPPSLEPLLTIIEPHEMEKLF